MRAVSEPPALRDPEKRVLFRYSRGHGRIFHLVPMESGSLIGEFSDGFLRGRTHGSNDETTIKRRNGSFLKSKKTSHLKAIKNKC